MTRFLDNLIAKSQGSGALVRPRLPSLFEGPSGNTGPSSAQANAAQESFVETQAPPNLPQAMSVPYGEDASSRRELETRAMSVRMIHEQPPRQVTAKPSAPSTLAATDPTGRSTPHAEKTAAALRSPKIDPPIAPRPSHGEESTHSGSERETARVVPVVVVQSEFKPGLRSEPALGRQPLAPIASLDRQTQIPSKSAAEPLPQRQRIGETVPKVTIIERPKWQSSPVTAVPNRRKQAFSEPKSPPEPTINVTIGRIEVRAIASASATPAKERSGPKPMSLADYMRQRAGGGRE